MLRYANELMSIRLWGAAFLVCSLLMATALLVHRRDLYRFALLYCAFSMTVWTVVAAAGIFTQPVAYSAWAWPAIIACACWASNRSLARGERDQPRG